ncbi:MAG: hypothetical protein SFT68_04800 [Rickettsiaceae bacterium]|nr:hypothetical protein [Rickettsiaceae bacterium]
MRFNIFSSLLTSIIFLGFIKITHLLDKVVYQSHITKNYASALVSIQDSYASSETHANTSEAKTDTPEPAGEGSKEAQPEQDKSHTYGTSFLNKGYTEEEIKVLMELSTRRDALDKFQKELNTKETLLKTTADKIEAKTKELSALEEKINNLMSQLQEKSNMRIKSLAKIYENMKPIEAATIFDTLEMPLLLELIRNMKEQKVASIIAQMNPQKAKEVSLEFAKISDSIGDIKFK